MTLLLSIWQLPQVLLGLLFCLWQFGLGRILSASYQHKLGAYIIVCQGNWGAVSLGLLIIGDARLQADVTNPLLQHEYGHVLQSRQLGWLYLLVVGLPSIFTAIFRNKLNHKANPVEVNADAQANKYFRQLTVNLKK